MTINPNHEEDWVPTADTFGARLALIRQAMGWTNLKAAALACGLPIESWRGWERGTNVPRDYMAVVAKIASVTAVNELWLATGVTSQDELRARRDSNSQPSDPDSVQVRPHLRLIISPEMRQSA